MPTDVLVLDYAPPGPRRRLLAAAAARLWAYSVWLLRWCLRNRHHLSGAAGGAVAAWVVVFAFDARVILDTPVYGGCATGRSFAQNKLYLAGWGLLSLPLFWLGARRSWWAVRVARTGALVALLWWLNMSFPIRGPRLFM